MGKKEKKRGYQTDFSKNNPYVFDATNRERKAKTLVEVLKREYGDVSACRVLNVGGGAGGIDLYVADSVQQVLSLDIDIASILFAGKNYKKSNLDFCIGDGMKLPFADKSFDVLICSHVYEHVPDASVLMSELERVMADHGVCYFAAGNRNQVMEPHYKLPFLSVLPKWMADIYMRVCNKGDEYYEKHLSYWGLNKLVSDFVVEDYTGRIVQAPEEYYADYMIPVGSFKQKMALFLFSWVKPLFPSYIWVLRKKQAVKGSY